MNERMVLNKFKDFTRIAAPVLNLKTEEAYEDALNMIEHLMESVGEDHSKPENFLILLLQHAIKNYEDQNTEFNAFEQDATEIHSDIAVLRTLLDQHNLTFSDLPEIGHKSLISKILSGERALTKTHIQKLSLRFKIDPSLFFAKT